MELLRRNLQGKPVAEQTRPFITNYARLVYNFDERYFKAADELENRALSYFQSIEQEVYDAVYHRMRDDRGGERENLRTLTTGGSTPTLVAFGDLVQTWVDEFGLEPGTFPPFGPDTLLYNWVAKHLDVTVPEGFGDRSDLGEAEIQDRYIVNVTFLVARAIYRRGLPAPSDYLHRPFGNTFDEFRPRVLQDLAGLVEQLSIEINGGPA